MHQCLIQINDHTFLSIVKHRHLWKEVFSWWTWYGNNLPLVSLLKPTILLYQWRKHTGAAGWRGLHIIIPKTAEEGTKDAAASLLL